MGLSSNKHKIMKGNFNLNLNVSIDDESRDDNDKYNDDDIEKVDVSNYTIDWLQTESIELHKNNDKITGKFETEQTELLKLRKENSELRDSLHDNKLYIEALNHQIMHENVNLKGKIDKNTQIKSQILEKNVKKELLFGGRYSYYVIVHELYQ